MDTPLIFAAARKPGSPIPTQEYYYEQPLLLVRPAPGSTATVTGGGVTDSYAFGSIQRRQALDGSEYESVPIQVSRNAQPWATLHMGYRMGLVAATTAATVPLAASENYELAGLPPPFVEGEVVEYVHRPSIAASPWGHFFSATSEADKALLDGNVD